ncbi:ABC transporter permease [Ruminococcus flavefaciens]|uniref:Putative ABC transport system permease protein n=1 Tax=Ruminococcus flavefaciens TaxID=1265 RepID=A0A1M7K6D4_RUMFL|nr:ABC transporter permease [Ruminococcus flavefaciens]SHM60543.1 putative ABC transport system permease protein [Ruminococcus flavefaciens]
MENEIKNGARCKNPLRKRVWRDCLRDWKRYLMIFLMLVLTIAFVSGMYVANNSMEHSLAESVDTYAREDGHFELSSEADAELLSALEKGEQADVAVILRERAYKEAEGEVEKAVRDAIKENIEESVASAIEQQVKEKIYSASAETENAMTDEQKEEMFKKALSAAMDENYDKAVKEALEKAYDSDEYKDALEDGLEEAKKKIDEEIDEKIGEAKENYELDANAVPVPVNIYELFYKELDERINSDASYEGTVRVYIDRDKVDRYDILEGKAPQNADEIAIDRMHADNKKLKVGDSLIVGGKEFKICGLIALVDYTTLFESNTDTMFNALTFDVGVMTKEGYDGLNSSEHKNYAFRYTEKPSDEIEEKEKSDSFLKVLISQTAVSEEEQEIKEYVPAYLSEAINFATDDMGNDKAMGGVLLYILTAVLAFIFAVTISTTLEKEASVIGTLRASGYTKGELVRYYMSAPLIIGVFAAIVGNILGYTVFKDIIVGMYRASYSLPSYKTLWTSEAFIRTTIIPIAIMLIINLIVIVYSLRLTPLRFLRHDLKRSRRKKAIRLPRWKFFSRFRMRVFLQNIPNYIMLFVGITFVMVLLSMAVGMPTTLSSYKESVDEMMFADHQIILTSTKDSDGNVIETNSEGAERFSMVSLNYKRKGFTEEVMVYGSEEGSRYIKLDKGYFGSGSNAVYVSKAFADKYDIKKDDMIDLSEKYENKDYRWRVYDIFDYSAGIAVFMSNDMFRSEFGKKEGYFTGYFTDEEITDIDEKYIAKVITSDDVAKIANQLDNSLGAYMSYFQYLCVIISAAVLYLLTKIIIEKNERSISMVKILGYRDGEISSLYMITTALVTIITELISLYLGYIFMKSYWRSMLMELGGWFEFKMTASGFVKEFVMVFIAYLIITVFDFIRIKKIPKVLALKNTE